MGKRRAATRRGRMMRCSYSAFVILAQHTHACDTCQDPGSIHHSHHLFSPAHNRHAKSSDEEGEDDEMLIFCCSHPDLTHMSM
jgi:predicted RNA polymerase sigma factor